MERNTRRLSLLSVGLGICAITLLPVRGGLAERLRTGDEILAFSASLLLHGATVTTAHDVILNMVLFLPLGFLLASVEEGGKSRFRRLAGVMVAGLLLSAAVETLQMSIPGRYPSLLDIASNGLGAWLGGVLAGLSPGRAERVT